MHPIIVFAIIGIFVASQKWHESFFWTMMGLSVISFFLTLVLEIKRAKRIIKVDREIAKILGEKHKPEPVKLPVGYYWFTIISAIVIWFFVLYALN